MALTENSARSPLLHKLIVATVMLGLFVLSTIMTIKPPSSAISAIGDTALENIAPADCVWMLISTALVLIMTPGCAFFYGGMVQHKNTVSTIMQTIMPMAIIPPLWSFIGFSLAFGNDAGYPHFIGNPATYGLMYNVGAVPSSLLAPTIPLVQYFLFQLMFAIVTPALIIGAIAERVNFTALWIFIFLWHIIVYCPYAHMTWHPDGLIHKWGVLDFAGGLVVHMSSGFSALVCAWYLGPAKGQKTTDVSHMVPGGDSLIRSGPANVPIVVLGAVLLWFGWFGFNAGSALAINPLAAQAFLNTNTATATAVLTWLLMDQLRGKKLQATGLCFGVVVGLVAITPASGFVAVGGAALIGMVAAMICSLCRYFMEVCGRQYVDDTLDVSVCHGISGTVGMFCTALLATTAVNANGDDGAFYGNGILLGKTLLVIVVSIPWFLVATLLCLWVTDKCIPLRVTSAEERIGLDVTKHGQKATTIEVTLQANPANRSFLPGVGGSPRNNVEKVLDAVKEAMLFRA